MSSGFPERALRLLAAGGLLFGTPSSPLPLRVCADPDNLPFSNRRGEGFENRLAELLARDLHTVVAYTWWPQRRGFVRKSLDAGSCDVIMGIPAELRGVLRTAPYYRSGYVFVTRRNGTALPRSLDDSALRRLRIGVQVIGDDGADTPPALALARRGMVANVTSFVVPGEDQRGRPAPARIIEAVATGRIDVAIAWGPLAGYWAARAPVPLRLTPVEPPPDLPGVPFRFAIAVGVRRSDAPLRARLDSALSRHRGEIDRLLSSYRVPELPQTGGGPGP